MTVRADRGSAAIRRVAATALGAALLAWATPAAAQISCPAGVRTVLAPTARAAEQALLRGSADAALSGARGAVGADPRNAANHRLLGRVQAAAGRFADSEAAFREAERLCPAYTRETRLARRLAAESAFESGLAALEKADTAAAVTHWEAAARLSDDVYRAELTLAFVRLRQGRSADAAAGFRRALEGIARAGETTAEETRALREARYLALSGLAAAGTALFQAQTYAGAVEAFRYATAADSTHRDAWYNLALALFKLERPADLVPVAQRLIRIDPLNENAHVILYNAYRSLYEAAQARGDGAETARMRQIALEALGVADSLPIKISGIAIDNRVDGSARITGTVHGGTAPPGQRITLDFSLHTTEATHARTVTVTAPAKDLTAPFEIELPAGGPFTSYAYRVR